MSKATAINRERRKYLYCCAVTLLLFCTLHGGSLVNAFHDGGVGDCSGCHVSHTGDGGTPQDRYLLLADNPTDTCLLCHETSFGNVWGTSVLNPGPVFGGGQFVFLLEDNLNDGPNGTDPSAIIQGHRAGHSVISVSRGTQADPVNAVAPGGTYPSSSLHCTSCHDPHGKGGNYRLLYGSGDTSNVLGFAFTYTQPAPQAIGIPLSGPPESNDNHPVYLSGVSAWCGQCHGDYHESGMTGFEHPGDHTFDPEMANQYNIYQGTGFDTGDGSDSYLAQTPYQDSTITDTAFRGPAGFSSRVMCLSCHRAHASSGPGSGRWDFNINTWADEGLLSGSFPIPNPYTATAGNLQKELCEKCHGTDVPN